MFTLNDQQPALLDSRSSDPNHGGSAVIHLDRIILFALFLAFGSIAAHSFSELQSAFSSAYREHADQIEVAQKSAAPNNSVSHFHTEYFSDEVVRWEPAILQWSEDTGLPADLIAVVMQIESCGDQRALSSAGAMGIFQVMPYHFGASEDPFDPEVNAKRGLAYLAKGYELSDGQIDVTLAGYNGGHSQIDRKPEYWPSETQRYVHWGVGIWQDIQAVRHPSPTLQRWLAAGGARLCASASATALLGLDSN